MFHKIKSVVPLPGYVLLVTFAEGVTKAYDLTPLFTQYKPFAALEATPGLYGLARIDAGGYGVIWNDDLDISCDELYENGRLQATPFDGLISFSDATALWGLSESTLRKAVSYGKLKDGIDVRKFGKQWIVTLDAMRREYGEPNRTGA